jgi:hypothetical protein
MAGRRLIGRGRRVRHGRGAGRTTHGHNPLDGAGGWRPNSRSRAQDPRALRLGVGDASALRARGGPAAPALPSTPVGRRRCAGDEQGGLGVAARTRVAFHVERSHRLCLRRSTWNGHTGSARDVPRGTPRQDGCTGHGRHPGIASPPGPWTRLEGTLRRTSELVAPRRREMAGGSSAFAPAPRSTEPQAARAASPRSRATGRATAASLGTPSATP